VAGPARTEASAAGASVEPGAGGLGVGPGADPHAASTSASQADTRSRVRHVLLTG
jgi:hypothetical protein